MSNLWKRVKTVIAERREENEHRKRIKDDKAVIDSSLDKLIGLNEKLYHFVGAEQYERDRKDRLSCYPKNILDINDEMYEVATTPGKMHALFTDLINSEDVKQVFASYPDLLVCEGKNHTSRFIHAEVLNKVFLDVCEYAHLEDTLDIAKSAGRSSVMLASINGDVIEKESVSWGLVELASKATTDEKIALYTALDHNNFLQSVWSEPRLEKHNICKFIEYIFQGIETDAALQRLKHSKAWNSLDKRDFYYDNLVALNQHRFLPALEYNHLNKNDIAS